MGPHIPTIPGIAQLPGCWAGPGPLGGPHENPDPAKKVVPNCTLTAERWDPGPAPMDSWRKVRSKMFPGHLAQFYAWTEIWAEKVKKWYFLDKIA